MFAYMPVFFPSNLLYMYMFVVLYLSDLTLSVPDGGDGPRDRYRRDSDDRTANDWRRGPREDNRSPPRDYRDGHDYHDRERYDRRGGGG